MAYTLVKNELPHRAFPSIASIFPNLEAWSVGFDREWRMLEQLQNSLIGGTSSYPPYNIKQTGEHAYEIEMAVAGFSKDELRIELNNNQLVIEGHKVEQADSAEAAYVYKGIAARQFRQNFALADHVKVNGSQLRDGILCITLERDLPEEKKPRMIEIN